MKQTAKRWSCILLGTVLLLLTLCGVITYIVDPCLYYRIPQKWQPVFFNERYQAAGMAKHVEAETVLMGSSMAANYRASDIGETFGTTAVRITVPDGYFQEFDQVMEVLYRKEQPPKHFLLILDPNILLRDDSEVGQDMPPYLYDQNPFNDVKYLLSKDSLYYSAYVLASNLWGTGETLDEGFTWDKTATWSAEEAKRYVTRPEEKSPMLPEDTFYPALEANLQVVERWVTEHPETDFQIFFPPYSILFWEQKVAKGELDAEMAALGRACEALLKLPNVRLYGFLFDREIVTNLDNYCDHIHHSGAVCKTLLGKLKAGEGELLPDTWQETLASWKDFVVHYDYDRLWESAPAVS